MAKFLWIEIFAKAMTLQKNVTIVNTIILCEVLVR